MSHSVARRSFVSVCPNVLRSSGRRTISALSKKLLRRGRSQAPHKQALGSRSRSREPAQHNSRHSKERSQGQSQSPILRRHSPNRHGPRNRLGPRNPHGLRKRHGLRNHHHHGRQELRPTSPPSKLALQEVWFSFSYLLF